MNCDYIIKGRYILPVIDNKWIENGAVAVSGTDILAVGEACALEKKYKVKKVIDAGNSIVMPGLINTHTHAAMAYFRGLADDLPLIEWLENNIWPAERRHVNAKFIKRSGELAVLEMLKSGITCFNDMYFFEEVLGGVAERAGQRAILGEGNLDLLSERTVAIHSVWLKKGDFDILKEKNVKISHNPISNMKLASGISPIIEMTREHGITVGLGTDGAASNNTLDLFSEMKMCSMLHKITGLNPEILNAYEIVKMATIDAARVLGKENHLGSLEAGKKADIITINLDKPHLTPIYNPFSHLVYCVEAQDVENVMVNGKMVMCKREVANMDEEMIIKEGELFRIKN